MFIKRYLKFFCVLMTLLIRSEDLGRVSRGLPRLHQPQVSSLTLELPHSPHLPPLGLSIGPRTLRLIGRLFHAAFPRAGAVEQMLNDALRGLLGCQLG